MSSQLHPSSFRDPDGVVVSEGERIFRILFNSYQSDYDLLNSSGLYKELTTEHKLVQHEERDPEILKVPYEQVYKILEPEKISFISYPYEWSFCQLKKAALLTLDIQLHALEKGMTLKDASAFNVQFRGINPVFIDTASFTKHIENSPWQAYGQFCRHFLGPLLLWTHGKKELVKLSLNHIDGIPLSVISYSLPRKTKFSFFVLSHIHYHARLESKHQSDISAKGKKLAISKSNLTALIQHLKSGIEKLDLKKESSEWTDYYETFSYDKENYEQKKQTVESFITSLRPKSLLDLGCNEGEFSLLCSKHAAQIVAVDSDILVINRLHQKLAEQKINSVLPLHVDISNPTPGIGLNNTERESFLSRSKFDALLALALIHHLTIGNNIPFERVAELLSKMTKYLVIEFVPKEDVQAQRLMVTRKDIFVNYTLEHFRKSFSLYFTIEKEQSLKNSGRILFMMKTHA